MESDSGGMDDANEKPDRIDEASEVGEENGFVGK
jgi:hypothetical protein